LEATPELVANFEFSGYEVETGEKGTNSAAAMCSDTKSRDFPALENHS
jgi:hypothetical protein